MSINTARLVGGLSQQILRKRFPRKPTLMYEKVCLAGRFHKRIMVSQNTWHCNFNSNISIRSQFCTCMLWELSCRGMYKIVAIICDVRAIFILQDLDLVEWSPVSIVTSFVISQQPRLSNQGDVTNADQNNVYCTGIVEPPSGDRLLHSPIAWWGFGLPMRYETWLL